MNQVKKILFAVLEAFLRFVLARKNVVVHYCFIALYVILSGLLSFAVLVLAFVQFLWLLITTKPLNPIQSLSHRLAVYLYKILRFITLNEPGKPYPFSPIPQEIEPAEDVDLTVELPEKKFFGGDAAEGAKSPAGDAGSADAPKEEAAADASTPETAEAKKEDAPVEEAPQEPIEMGYEEKKTE